MSQRENETALCNFLERFPDGLQQFGRVRQYLESRRLAYTEENLYVAYTGHAPAPVSVAPPPPPRWTKAQAEKHARTLDADAYDALLLSDPDFAAALAEPIPQLRAGDTSRPSNATRDANVIGAWRRREAVLQNERFKALQQRPHGVPPEMIDRARQEAEALKQAKLETDVKRAQAKARRNETLTPDEETALLYFEHKRINTNE